MTQACDIITPQVPPAAKLLDLVWSNDGPPIAQPGPIVVGARVQTLDPRLMVSVAAFLMVEGKTAVQWPDPEQITVSMYPVMLNNAGPALGAPAPEADNTPLLLDERLDGRIVNAVGFSTNPGTYAVDVIVRLKSTAFPASKLFDRLSVYVGAEVGISPAARLDEAVDLIHRVRVSNHERTRIQIVGSQPD